MQAPVTSVMEFFWGHEPAYLMSDDPLWVPVTMFTFANEFLQHWLGHWVTGGVTLTLGWVPQRMCPGTPPWTRHSAIVFSIPALCGIGAVYTTVLSRESKLRSFIFWDFPKISLKFAPSHYTSFKVFKPPVGGQGKTPFPFFFFPISCLQIHPMPPFYRVFCADIWNTYLLNVKDILSQVPDSSNCNVFLI